MRDTDLWCRGTGRYSRPAHHAESCYKCAPLTGRGILTCVAGEQDTIPGTPTTLKAVINARPSRDGAPIGSSMLAKKQNYKHGSNTLFMNNFPKLPQGVKEDHESRINKAIYWLRKQRGCLSVIRMDISNAKRHSPPEFNHDIISIEFYDKSLIDHLFAFDIRTRAFWVKEKRGGINLEFGKVDALQVTANVQMTNNTTSNSRGYVDTILPKRV
ncbi:hypothetical protein NDU88_000002 [Pleurodeles waltl]|uniref:Uncharacterized protein n=1 Tax=Pleurodeles waltl TaxID=8319 RepID=A0AAV7N8Z7_PLEWA|nr:hypothetical protein NDU88_000002 [Pleurodeles waltl]